MGRQRLWCLLLFASVAVAGLFYAELRDDRRVEAARAATSKLAFAEATALRGQLVRSVSSVQALASIIHQYGGIPDFPALAADMIASYGGISNLQLAPGGVIREIHPLPGNQRALGLDLLDPATPGSAEARDAVATRRLTVAGPIEVVQGGVALVARSPVYLGDSEEGSRFWGFATALIRVGDLLASAQLPQRIDEAGFDFALAVADAVPGRPFAASTVAPLRDPVRLRFEVLGKSWELAMAPRGGWSDASALARDAVLAALLSALVSMLLWVQLHRPARLAAQAARHTQDLDAANRDLNRRIDQRLEAETALRHSEARYRAVFEHATDAVFVFDRQERIEEANPEACRLLGYARQELLLLGIEDIAPRENCIDFDAALSGLPAGESVHVSGRMRRQDGDVLPVEVRVGRFEEEGEPRFIAVARDMSAQVAIREALEQANRDLERQVYERTSELREVNRNLIRETQERQQVEVELREAMATAEAANQAKSQFLGIISHEIRTPMNGMLGMLSLLRETDPPAELQSYIEVADASGKLLMGLLGELVDISHIERGQVAVTRSEIESARLLKQVTELHRWRASEKGLELRLECAPDLPDWILVDDGRLRQVLNNLIGNAVKFTEKGGVTIVADYPRDGRLRVAISDTGVGIDVAAQETIFNSFVQADSSIARRYGGSGLGLAIARQLLVSMDGTIDLVSRPGEGSRFVIELPAPRVGDTPSPGAPPDDRPTATGRCHVLVAEDNVVNQKVAIGMLRNLGCDVTAVADGREVLERVAAQAFDLVLMDCQMPNLDGYETTRELRRREVSGTRLPVVAMTAHVLPGDVARCLEAGMDDHLGKPITLERLRRVLERWALPASAGVDGG